MFRIQLRDLKEWAESTHKPLVIRGARQVGKSTLVELFAKEAKFDLITLNFDRNPELQQHFEERTPKDTLHTLELVLGKEIIVGKALLFLDEIQSAPNVFRALRYFYEDIPNLHIIAAGSLLDFELAAPSFSVPVGRLSYMHIGPMTFMEFLLALGKNKLYEFLRNWEVGQDIPITIHENALRLLKVYFSIGGMPESVKEYVKTESYKKCEIVKHDLLATYQEDFSKYGTSSQNALLRTTFQVVPAMIGQKIKYVNISQNHRAKEVEIVIDKLSKARVIHKILRSSANGLPLGAEENRKFFKLLFLDIGLISTMLKLSTNPVPNVNLMVINSGALAEQYVGQALLHSLPYYREPMLHYWAREKKSSSAELDYVIECGSHVIPVEVKAGKTGRLKSLLLFMEEKNSTLGIRFNSERPSVLEKPHLLSLPLYLAEECRRICESLEA